MDQITLDAFRACFAAHYSGPLSLHRLLPACAPVQVNEGEYLWHADTSQHYLYALHEGLLYACFETTQGKSFCKEVYWEQDLIFGFRSLLTGSNYPYYVKALEPSRLVRIHKQAYLNLVTQYADWQQFHTAVVSEYYMYKEGKEEFLLMKTPEQRVSAFFRNYPELVKRVPQHIVASYLGITPISFSRIKKRLDLNWS